MSPSPSAARLLRRGLAPLHHRLLHRRFAADTMVPKPLFLENLRLTEPLRPLPGCIVECGVWRGGMIAAIASLLGPDRHYHLFDSFAGLPAAQPIDGPAALHWQADPQSPSYFDNCTATQAQAQATLQRTLAPHVHFHPGWFQDTLPLAHFTQPIALLRLDGDWYDSTLLCLQHLFPRVADHGRILIDDYGIWEGCTKAVHDYLSQHQRPEPVQTQRGVAFIDKLPQS